MYKRNVSRKAIIIHFLFNRAGWHGQNLVYYKGKKHHITKLSNQWLTFNYNKLHKFWAIRCVKTSNKKSQYSLSHSTNLFLILSLINFFLKFKVH